MTDKEILREASVRARERLTPEERAEKSAAAMVRIAEMPEYRRAGTVMIYRAVRGELSPETLPGLPASAGKRFAYPLCLEDREMAAMIPVEWRRGAVGIPEPERESSEEVPPEEIDLVICPGTAFDGEGNRLGMGGGYYDRFLPKCRKAAVILAAFEAQRADAVPHGPRDVCMDRIVTEAGIYPGKRTKECG